MPSTAVKLAVAAAQAQILNRRAVRRGRRRARVATEMKAGLESLIETYEADARLRKRRERTSGDRSRRPGRRPLELLCPNGDGLVMRVTSSAAAPRYGGTRGPPLVTGEEVSERGRIAGWVASHFLLIWIGP